MEIQQIRPGQKLPRHKRLGRFAVKWITLAAITGCLSYALYSRPLLSLLTATWPIATGIFIAIELIFLMRGPIFHKAYDRQWEDMRVISMVIALSAIVAALIYYSIGVAIADGYSYVRKMQLSLQQATALVGVATATAGLALFTFRKRFRAVYGLTEAMTGIAVAMHQVSKQGLTALNWDSGIFFAILTAGVYLVVRGFDNIQTAIDNPKLDPLAAWMFRLQKDEKLV